MNKPDHMGLHARNARIYETLKSMGLYIEPYLNKQGDIDFLAVSAGRSMRIEPVYKDETEKEVDFWKISTVYPLTEEEIKSMMALLPLSKLMELIQEKEKKEKTQKMLKEIFKDK